MSGSTVRSVLANVNCIWVINNIWSNMKLFATYFLRNHWIQTIYTCSVPFYPAYQFTSVKPLLPVYRLRMQVKCKTYFTWFMKYLMHKHVLI